MMLEKIEKTPSWLKVVEGLKAEEGTVWYNISRGDRLIYARQRRQVYSSTHHCWSRSKVTEHCRINWVKNTFGLRTFITGSIFTLIAFLNFFYVFCWLFMDGPMSQDGLGFMQAERQKFDWLTLSTALLTFFRPVLSNAFHQGDQTEQTIIKCWKHFLN